MNKINVNDLTGECHTSAWYVFTQYLHNQLFVFLVCCQGWAVVCIFVTKTSESFLSILEFNQSWQLLEDLKVNCSSSEQLTYEFMDCGGFEH